MTPSRAAIVATAGESIARGSRSFAAASRLFDRPTRERAWLLYAWCRACDDLADGQDHGFARIRVTDAQYRLAVIKTRTEAALAGEWVGDAAFDALRLFAQETALPPALARDLIAGFALDAEDWRPRSERDLMRYCYHVAGAVGCMMALAMGVSPDDEATLDRACDLGLAFQLANIARDIEEDDRVGRCYLPMEWLAEMDIPPGQHMKPAYRARLTEMVARLVALSERHEASARIGTRALSPRSAWAVLSAAGIYGAIGREVRARGAQAWDHRVSTGGAMKLAIIARAAVQAARRHIVYPEQPRDPTLWTRPRTNDEPMVRGAA